MMNKSVKASATIEMAYIMPVIFLVFTAAVYLMFYYHDKNILAGAAYETAVAGSQKMRAAGADDAGAANTGGGSSGAAEGGSEEMIESMFQSRIRRKLILFPGAFVSVSCTKQQVEVTAIAMRKNMRLKVTGRSAVTKPETFIRNHRKAQGVIAGE